MGIFRMGVILGGNIPKWEFSGWELSGGNHSGGDFPGGRFLEISKLYNVITKKVTFSTNQKLNSIAVTKKFEHVRTFQLIESKNE